MSFWHYHCYYYTTSNAAATAAATASAVSSREISSKEAKDFLAELKYELAANQALLNVYLMD